MAKWFPIVQKNAKELDFIDFIHYTHVRLISTNSGTTVHGQCAAPHPTQSATTPCTYCHPVTAIQPIELSEWISGFIRLRFLTFPVLSIQVIHQFHHGFRSNHQQTLKNKDTFGIFRTSPSGTSAQKPHSWCFDGGSVLTPLATSVLNPLQSMSSRCGSSWAASPASARRHR